MRSLITGSCGFIGTHLTKRLLDAGEEVVGIDRFSDYYDPSIKRANLAEVADREGFSLIEKDINDVDPVELLDGIDVVYHLAGQPGVRASWGKEFGIYLSDNIAATQRLLEAARSSELEKFVFASSSSVYGNAERFPTTETDKPHPVSPYGVSKLAAEHLCRQYAAQFGVPTVSLRYFTVFGPGQRPDMAFTRFVEAAITGGVIEIYGDGEQSRDFTFVTDAVAATNAAGLQGKPGAVYNVAGGTEATVNQALDKIAELAGNRPEIRYSEAAAGDARKTGGDTTLARQELGYDPQVDINAGLEAQFEAAKQRLGG